MTIRPHWATTKTPGIALTFLVGAFGVLMAPRCTSQTAMDAGHRAEYSPYGIFTTDKLVTKQINTPVCLAGTLTTGAGPFNDWSPSCLATNTTIQVQAGDNNGSVITGINATNAALGDWIELCNANAPQDDGVLALVAESSSSTAANRIWTPEFGRDTGQTPGERYTIGPSTCVQLIRVQPDQLDATKVRWMVVDSARRTLDIVKLFQLFPYSQPAAITGTVNDYDLDDACAALGGPVSGTCEAGGSVKQTTYSVILFSTVDGTGATVTGLRYVGSVNGEGHGPVKWLYNLGPGPVTLKNGCGGTASAQLNQFCFVSGGSNLGDIVLNGGAGVLLWHTRDAGFWLPLEQRSYYFSERDANFAKGIGVKGYVNQGGGISSSINVGDTGSVAVNSFQLNIEASPTYTAGNTNEGIRIHSTPTNVSVNAAIEAFATGGTTNYNFAGTSSAMIDNLGDVVTEANLKVGGGNFSNTTRQEICAASTAPTVNHGTLASDSSNCIAEVTGIGAFTSVTLTFGGGGFGTSAHCYVTVEGGTAAVITVSTVSNTAPVFSCWDMAGVAMNCPNFVAHCWGH